MHYSNADVNILATQLQNYKHHILDLNGKKTNLK